MSEKLWIVVIGSMSEGPKRALGPYAEWETASKVMDDENLDGDEGAVLVNLHPRDPAPE
jgi:hypothetical protein